MGVIGIEAVTFGVRSLAKSKEFLEKGYSIYPYCDVFSDSKTNP